MIQNRDDPQVLQWQTLQHSCPFKVRVSRGFRIVTASLLNSTVSYIERLFTYFSYNFIYGREGRFFSCNSVSIFHYVRWLHRSPHDEEFDVLFFQGTVFLLTDTVKVLSFKRSFRCVFSNAAATVLGM